MSTVSAFALPAALSDKDDPALTARDDEQLAAITAALETAVADLEARLDAARRAPGGGGTAAFERDQQVHRLTARLRTLRRYGPDLCLGRMVHDGTRQDGTRPDGGEAVTYVGRLALTDAEGNRLLVDWRSAAAAPFFGATHADPMGLVSRRRFRWTDGRVTDYWDEVFVGTEHADNPALDDQSAFLASLGAARSDRMRDVLGTIAADQDAIIRAGSAGTLVVDGGPGTGKTVVALHRAAYLLHADPRVGRHHGRVLVVGPHRPYLDYVADVLPSLGEEGVRTCLLRDMVPEGASAAPEPDPRVAALKGDARMPGAIEPAVALYEAPPTEPLLVETPWADVWVEAADWAEAYGAVEPGTPHNEARDQIAEALVAICVDRARDALGTSADGWLDGGPVDDLDDGADGYVGAGDPEEAFDAYGLGSGDPDEALRAAFVAARDLHRTLARAWPLLEPADLVGDLWTVPAYLRRCAPWLSEPEAARLQRTDPRAWTVEDLPLLDAARRRLGDPQAAGRRRRARDAEAAEQARVADVVDHLVATDDSDLQVMSMLRGQDLRSALVDPGALVSPSSAGGPEELAGPFAHVIVDEAQELTDAEWQMLLARCPSRSLTVVGDRAQARRGFAGSWADRLERVGLDRVHVASLRINYRTPAEIMAAAALEIRSVLPDANVPTSVRSTGVPVRHEPLAERDTVLNDWLATHDGVVAVIGDPGFTGGERVRSLTPVTAKGLELDLVVLVDPQAWGEVEHDAVAAAVDRYVAMTRATQELVVLTG